MRMIAVFALLLSGCAGLPGQVSTTESDFDGTREVYMEPGTVNTPEALLVTINLGAHWSSREPDTVYLIARTPHGAETIRRRDGLQFNIDGEIVKLDSSQWATEHDFELIGNVAYSSSRRAFAAPLSLVEDIAESEGTRIKLLVGQTEYRTGRLEDGVNTAYRGLLAFLDEVRAHRRPDY